jgi:hypothetical protein
VSEVWPPVLLQLFALFDVLSTTTLRVQDPALCLQMTHVDAKGRTGSVKVGNHPQPILRENEYIRNRNRRRGIRRYRSL